MKISDILEESKKSKKKTRKNKTRNMYSSTSRRAPVGVFGGWFWGVGGSFDGGGGDGGGGE